VQTSFSKDHLREFKSFSPTPPPSAGFCFANFSREIHGIFNSTARIGFWFLPTSILIIVLLVTSASRASFSYKNGVNFGFLAFLNNLPIQYQIYQKNQR
jgi:hypothetical protein